VHLSFISLRIELVEAYLRYIIILLIILLISRSKDLWKILMFN